MSLPSRLDRAGGGLWVDLGLYGLSALFAWWTVVASTLAPHRAWGGIAVPGYACAALMTAAMLCVARLRRQQPGWIWRAALAVAAWVVTCLVPLVVEAVQRAAGRTDRAQEEVLVVEGAGHRLLDAGTPYLDRTAIAAFPDQLLGYMPYQPGMAYFGLPRALDPGVGWWSDARVWFTLVTAVALGPALIVLARAGASRPAMVRALQAVTVLPVAALTLATGGDDLPVLALCLLALVLASIDRFGAAGLAAGAAAALKLFAWPVALILGVYAWRAVAGGASLRPAAHRVSRYIAGAVALPLLTAVPVVLVDAAAMVENVIAFPFGQGLVSSPAASPLPGHLIATSVPGGDVLAKVLLALAALAVSVILVRRPPRSAAEAATLAGLALLAAMLLLPSTRFGYLLYPAAFLLWAPALREAPATSTTEQPLVARL
jgi:hypothetical protein